MKESIVSGPIGVTMYAPDDFSNYKSGVYTGCGTDFDISYRGTNHAVIIVGYDADGNYIIKNSWGTKWGTNGFGVVSKNADCAMSAWVHQYSSKASPGTDLVYTDLKSLKYERNLIKYCWLFMSTMVALFLIMN